MSIEKLYERGVEPFIELIQFIGISRALRDKAGDVSNVSPQQDEAIFKIGCLCCRIRC